jgi:glycosyltransferase involved in cell wall biosynthesis
MESFLVAGLAPSNPDPETGTYIEKLNDLSNVNFVGTVSRNEILDFFKKAKFLLNTSRYEGFSNTFLEAMCTGTPILSTAMVNPDGIISKYGLGYIYKDPTDIQGFLGTIDDVTYGMLSANCIEFVKNQHNHLHLGRKLLNFLHLKGNEKTTSLSRIMS